MSRLEQAYRIAQEQFAEQHVDTEAALKKLQQVSISLHCWQGDDVVGFEGLGESLGGGLAVTGHYPGRARTIEELRSDLKVAYGLIPGKHRLNLHACYGDFRQGNADRNAIDVTHFQSWIDWAQEQRLSLDFNPTFFAHAKASSGFTLAHEDLGIRRFWIEHGLACRKIAAAIGEAQGNPCVTNVWIPDGMKDLPVDRTEPRRRLMESLDEIFRPVYSKNQLLDAVESKLFGLGSESYVVGSHEFYLGYAITRQVMLCLDSGHFHPTESIADKISSTLQYVPRVLLHVSRGVRWDSDHVVTLNDDLHAICQELVRGDYLDRVHLGLDYFDASINRIAAWVVGTRNTLKALLIAMLEPMRVWREVEASGDYTRRLALTEEFKRLPWGAVWDYYCQMMGVPVGAGWIDHVREYEQRVLVRRAPVQT